LRTISAIGLSLSVVGAILDFVSGYVLVLDSSSMTMAVGADLLVGVGLVALGIAVLATGLMMVSRRAADRTNLLGALMEIFGILMGLVSAYTPSMNGGIADLMLVVGILMFLNGILMQSWKNSGMKS
jgi:uncharacterized membrane protein HdeD (DUF308 family)